MKRIICLVSFAILFVACDKQNPEKESEIGKEYSVYEEAEISSEDFLETALKSIATLGYSFELQQMQKAYDAAIKRLMPVEEASTTDLYFKITKITYTTKDEKDKDVKVSALVIYPKGIMIDKVILINHGTHMGMFEVPTNMTSPCELLAVTGALCILPDNIGLGASSKHKELYLNADVQGRTSVDALLALYTFAQDRQLLGNSFNTYIWGYSQGGASSLASLREFQTRPSYQQEAFNLTKVICGDGPYDLLSSHLYYMEDDANGKAMGFGASIPALINGMFNSYPNEMSNFKYENFFTSWALSTGVPQAIREKKESPYDMLVGFKGKKLSEIMDLNFLGQKSEASAAFAKALERQNLCNNWKPQYPLQFFHCNPDPVVPYVNLENAHNGLANQYVLEPDTPDMKILEDKPLFLHFSGFFLMMSNTMNGKYF